MTPPQNLGHLPQDQIGWGAGDSKKSLLQSSISGVCLPSLMKICLNPLYKDRPHPSHPVTQHNKNRTRISKDSCNSKIQKHFTSKVTCEHVILPYCSPHRLLLAISLVPIILLISLDLVGGLPALCRELLVYSNAKNQPASELAAFYSATSTD